MGLPKWPLASASLAAAAFVALAEIDRLVAEVVDRSGATWSFSYVFGPGRALSPWDGRGRLAWDAWAGSSQPASVKYWLLLNLLFDVIFIVGYGTLLWLFFRRHLPRAVLLVAVLIGMDVVEDVLALKLALDIGNGRTSWVVHVLPWVTTGKWLAVVVLGLWVLYRLFSREGVRWRAAARRQAKAVYLHRLSVLALIPIAALAVLPGGEVFDQLPDVERRWLESGAGWWQLVAATVALAILAAVLFVLGRVRSDRTWRELARPETLERAASDAVWLVTAGVIAALAVLFRLAGARVNWVPVCIVVGALLAVVILSRVVDRFAKPRPAPLSAAIENDGGHLAATTLLVGDGLAAVALVLAGLGLVRAFVTPAVLQSGLRWLAVGVGVLCAPLVWLGLARFQSLLEGRADGGGERPGQRPVVLRRISRRLDPRYPDYPDETAVGRWTVPRIVVAAAGAVTLLALGLFPVSAAAVLGALAGAVLALAGLVALLGTATAVSLERQPVALFRLMHLRTTPITTLVIVAVAVPAVRAGDPELHGIRGPAASGARGWAAIASRPNMNQAFRTWLSQSTLCDHVAAIRLPGQLGTRQMALRPMVLVASAGGGIRAAYWTAAAMQRMAPTPDGCGGHSALLSSGVSGGSVGLAVASSTSGPAQAGLSVAAMAAPDALGAASVGLLVRDDLAAATGVHLPVYGTDTDVNGQDGRWHDRAGLMERVWESAAPSLGQPFLGGPRGRTGPLILNSTSAGTGCRVLVSQVSVGQVVPPATSSATDPRCHAGSSPLPATFDLLGEYGQGPKDPTGQPRCIVSLRTSTAAMLSARFPFITPSGVVGPCDHRTTQQLVDGGYAEGSGLGTLIDLAPSWLELARRQDAQALHALTTQQTPAAPPVFVVPVVVLLDNHYRTDITPSTSHLTSEPQVPLQAKAAGAEQRERATLLQRAFTLVDTRQLCPDDTAVCGEVSKAIAGLAPRRVIVVAPATTPTLTAPLGWVLSRNSIENLNKALDGQAGTPCARAADVGCTYGYGRLADLLQLLGSPSLPGP